MPAPRLLAVALVLLLPAALATHTPPGLDVEDGGDMACGRERSAGAATTRTLPILRTTDWGHLEVHAEGTAPAGVRCEFAVEITGYALPGGMNPQGGLDQTFSVPCVASGGTCVAEGHTGWWVTFVDPVNGVLTPEIDVAFDLLVDGAVVASGVVRIVEPSLPAVPLP